MKIVIMGGSFNPPTVAHLSLMRRAMESVGAEKGIFVPSSDGYVRNKMSKQGKEGQTLPEALRLEMLRAMVKDDPSLTVDDREFRYVEKRYTYDTMESIQEDYPEDILYFLAGNDKLGVIPRWGRIDSFLCRFRIIVCRRDGDDPERSIAADPFLSAHRESLFVMEAPHGLDGISSTAVRNSLERGDLSCASMCHPDVWALLLKYFEL